MRCGVIQEAAAVAEAVSRERDVPYRSTLRLVLILQLLLKLRLILILILLRIF